MVKKLKLLLLGSFLLALVNSCNKNTQKTGVDLPKDFENFYQKFHDDSVFQLSHIQFPLEGLNDNALPDSIDSVFNWQKESWVLHTKIDLKSEAFEQSFEILDSTLIIERIFLKDKTYGMERRWSKSKDGWYLIYYIGMNKLLQKSENNQIKPDSIKE